MTILVKLLETSGWICKQCLSWDGSSLAVTYLLTWKLRAKVKLVCSENPGRQFRCWNQMYIILFFKGSLERLVGSKCCLVAVQNIATICAAEEAMTLITHNPHRGNLVACQVSLNWLWLGGGGLSRTIKNKPALGQVRISTITYLNILMQNSVTALLEALPS